MADPQRLTIFLHGDPGSGKSWLSNTAPGPRLYLDAEGRAEYLGDTLNDPLGRTRQRRIQWDPTQPVPEESTDPNVLTVVDIQGFHQVELAYRHLVSGHHPFNSVILDSVTELQQRLIDQVAGTAKMDFDGWGTVLRDLEKYVRNLRDLRKHPTHPLWAIVVTGGSQEKNHKQRALLQGQLATKIAYHFDVEGYMRKSLDAAGNKRRELVIDGYAGDVEAKDNTNWLSAHYGDAILNPNISEMLAVLNDTQEGTP